MHIPLTHVAEGEPFRPSAREHNIFVDTARVVGDKRVIFDQPPLLPQGNGIELFHGIVIEQCNAGCSTYRVQRVHRYLQAECDSCDGSGSGSGPV